MHMANGCATYLVHCDTLSALLLTKCDDSLDYVGPYLLASQYL